MKRILLIALFVFSLNGFSQINTNITPLVACSPNNNGFATFDLTSKIPEILGSLNPANYTISFHVTQSDASTGTNVIINSASFTSSGNVQIIFVRVFNLQTGQITLTNFSISTVISPNAGTDGQRNVCETSTIPINLFSIINEEQTGGIWTRVSGTSGTLNATTGIFTPAIGSTSSNFIYTITSNSSCPSSTSIATIYVASATNCLPTNCATPTNLEINNASTSSVQLNWLEIGGANQWNVLALTCGSPIPNSSNTGWVTATTNSNFVLNGLNAGTCYSFYVRSVCSPSNVSNWSLGTSFTTSDFTGCGYIFTDNGGANANYFNNSDNITSICPTISGEAVTVSFTSFNVESSNDALYIYTGWESNDANLISSTNSAGNVPGGLPGGFWGSTIPGPITSSAPNGCLTFRFRSNATITAAGWTANVICSPIGQCIPPANFAVSSINGTSANLSWSGVESAHEILVLPNGNPTPTVNSQGITSTTTSYSVSGLSPNTCYSAYIRAICPTGTNNTPWSAASNFCTYDCSNTGQCASGLKLTAFLDSNNNGIKDANETIFNSGSFVYTINNSANPTFGYSNSGSFTLFEPNPNNVYSINFSINSNVAPYYTNTSNYTNVTVAANSGLTEYFFPITQLQNYNDLGINLVSYNNPNPGFNHTNIIIYKNFGTQTVASGTINFIKNTAVSLVATSPTTTTTSNGFTYNFSNLQPGETRSILVTMQVPTIPTISLGTILTNSATITPLTGDIIPANNSTSISQTVVGSYDPNDKMESHGEKIVFSNFNSSEYLTYTIRFENMGTANTQFIRVEDFLNSALNFNTVEVLNASHPFNFRRENNKLTWNFYNISLTPSSVNNTTSQGFVQFRVKPNAGYAVGTIIPNGAEIYFDYNPPIYTNTFNTEFVQNLKVSSFVNSSFLIYPNPSIGSVTIQMNESTEKIKNILIYNLLGKEIKKIENINSYKIILATEQLSTGMYLLEVETMDNRKIYNKLLVQ
jgi:hypothetical protein